VVLELRLSGSVSVEGVVMDFYTTLDAVIELLRRRGRVSYRALTEHFGLDDGRMDALRAELRYAHTDSVREDGQGLVWAPSDSNPDGAERRQLTVLFGDLVGSTPLSAQLDPEEFREVMRAYYDTCGKVIARFDGYIAQYLGDGLIVFFGHPMAHEDDAPRAVRAGLGIVEAIGQLNPILCERYGTSLAVRLGCHTGLVVVGEVVGDARHEITALGETPNIAAAYRLRQPLHVGHRRVDPSASRRSVQLSLVGYAAAQGRIGTLGGLPGTQ
jgi:class 3 adenylate cyclase